MKRDLFENSLREVIQLSASGSPTPGGGSVSAIAACFGAAMTSMVCNLTLGKKNYQDVQPQVQNLLDTVTELMARMEELVAQDIAVFDQLMAAYRLPRTTEDETARRKVVLQTALKEACDVPLRTARTCFEALTATYQLAPIGNKMAISDVGVSAVLLEAALQGVLLNVDINIPLIEDPDYVQSAQAEKDELITQAEELKAKIMETVRERISH